jgi:hypothetical protein
MVLPPWRQSRITVRTSKQEFEVADVIRQFEDDYRARYPVTPQQARVLAALKACRTAALGGHIYECSECGALEFVYHSCRDRHCMKCGKFKKAEWIERQKVVLLPIPYFHITFTTDHAINPLVSANQKVIYDAIFWAVSKTLQEFGKKYFGGTLGITAVLHTWGQQLDPHVHIHCIVTGGALSADGQQFRRSGADYLFDVVALSAEYRDRFCRKLKRLAKAGKPFADPELVYEYLSRYVHQVAISNYRIVKIERGQVYFEYHDNKAGGKKKVRPLAGVEFLRRFLWHVLPEQFVHIRHYGLHQSNGRKQKLPQARELLGLERAVPAAKELDLKEWLKEILGEEAVDRCPHCGAVGTMFKRSEFEQLNWLQLILFALLGLSLYGTVKRRGERR